MFWSTDISSETQHKTTSETPMNPPKSCLKKILKKCTQPHHNNEEKWTLLEAARQNSYQKHTYISFTKKQARPLTVL